MIQKKIKYEHENGLHMRPASAMTDIANGFDCDIEICKNDASADAKSIMQLIMLVVTKGEEITIKADGQDEKAAIEALTELIENDLENVSGLKN